jgi:tetratricopeptide (TPR) repeat protein
MAWLLAKEQLPESLLPLADAMGMIFPPEMPNNARFKELLAKMQGLPAPFLVVLDNANNLDDLEEHYRDLQQCKNVHFLFTTRAASRCGHTKKIEGLDDKTIITLFRRYYLAHQSTEDNLVLKLYEAVGKNTLVMEILAKNLRNINSKFKQPYPLSQILEDIRQKGVLNIRQGRQERETVRVYWHEWEISPAPPEDIITALFDTERAPLSEPERVLLSIFSILPTDFLPYELLENCLPHFADLDKVAESLVEKGWIEEEGTSLKCHPVVQAVIRKQHAPRLWADCKVLIERFMFLFETQNYFLVNLDHNEASAYASCVAAALHWVKEQNYTVGWVGIFLSDYYESVGKLIEALALLERTKSVFKAIEDARNYGICLSRIGDIYIYVGKLPEALLVFKEFLEIMENAYQTLPIAGSKRDLAIAYRTIGEIYIELGEPMQALPFFEHRLILSQKLQTASPQDKGYQQNVAIAYGWLGDTYQGLGEYQKALSFFEQNLALSEALYNDESDNTNFKRDVAVSHANLGMMHLLLEDFPRARTHYETSRVLCVELADTYQDYTDLQMNKAEIEAVCWAVGKLLGEAGDTTAVLQARATFNTLYANTKIVACEKKSAIIGRMLEERADLRALIVEMSQR